MDIHSWNVAAALVTWFYFHTWKVRGDTAVILVFLLFCGVFFLVHTSDIDVFSPASHSAPASLLYSTLLIATHIFAALTITVLYRVSPFHPLAAIPGPFWYKISSMRLAYTTSTGKRHIVIKGLHEKYGKFVRTGPNMLSVNSSNAVSQIYTQANCMDKSDAYVLGREKSVGLFFLPQRDKHNARKKAWAPAFSPSALASYHPCVDRRAKDLQACIERRMDPVTNSVNLTECLQHWAYDLMGDIVFGGSNRLELMQEGDPSKYVNAVQLATIAFEILGEIPWLFDILWHLPATGNVHSFEKRAGEMMTVRRLDNQGSYNDIAAHLLGEMGNQSIHLTDGELAVDGSLAITAGSDSTSSLLSFIFYFLTCNPEKLKRLRQELDDAFPPGTPLTTGGLSNLPYLNAVIDESLRLGTPFPGLPRVVPSGGISVDGVRVAAGTIISVPAYTQQTSPDNFSPRPDEFIPERWMDPAYTTNRLALMCFSFGPFSCLGRNLAIQELRTTSAHLILTLDFSFPEHFDPSLFRSSVLGIRTTLFPYPLLVSARRR